MASTITGDAASGAAPAAGAAPRAGPATGAVRVAQRPWLTVSAIMCCDLACIAAANVAVVLVRYVFGGQFHPSLYWQLWPTLGVFIVALACARTYALPVNPPVEARRLLIAIAAVYLGLGSLTFLLGQSQVYSRLIFLAACPVTFVAVLEGRWLLRMLAARRGWWGEPAVVVGCGRIGRRIVRTMLSLPELGLKPIGVLDDSPRRRRGFHRVPTLGDTTALPALAARHPRITFFIVAADLEADRTRALLTDDRHAVPRLVLVPDLYGVRSMGASAQLFGGMLGLSVNDRLLNRTHTIVKRCLDLALVVATSPVVLLVTVLIAAAIRIDSKGPVFFTHRRIGVGGRPIRVWKFRTMHRDADAMLEEHLNQDPSQARRWSRDHKLRADARITRVGRFLRRTSLDELPQVWNVLRGDMSLVGPRPIVDAEVGKYGATFELYKRVRPGLTGLWQISGRNDLRYADRVWLDEHYVRNWSIWMDLFILSRTLMVVILGRGAY